jgi:glycosyltransferase involved in cell wall biosynthesis
MLAQRYGVPHERIKIILTPIETAVFRQLDRNYACCSLNLDPVRRYLLFIGRLEDHVKRVSSLIGAFARVAQQYAEVDLLVAGSGPDEERLQRIAAETIPARVRFLGWVSEDEQKALLYNSADCLLLASRKEGFPTVVGESLACGTPVLASDVGGIRELVVEDETGWLFQAGDDEGLFRKLSLVLQSTGKLHSMRTRARQMAESRVSPQAVNALLAACFEQEKQS